MISMLLMKKLRLRETNLLTQGHIASQYRAGTSGQSDWTHVTLASIVSLPHGASSLTKGLLNTQIPPSCSRLTNKLSGNRVWKYQVIFLLTNI